jgi:hypothetical protein
LKFKSYSQKTWFIKMLLLSPKCSKTPPTSIFNWKNFSGGFTPGPPFKGEGNGQGGRGEREWKGKEGERDGRGIE